MKLPDACDRPRLSAEGQRLIPVDPVRRRREIGGAWSQDLREEGANTRLTLTEDGFIKPPLFRAVARLRMKPDATLRDFENRFVAHLEVQ